MLAWLSGMEATRYWVGVMVVSFAPVLPLFWLSIHPCVTFWRRVGVKTTLFLHAAGILIIGSVLVIYRDMLIRGDLGTHYVAVAVAVVLLTASVVMRFRVRTVLPDKVLIGFSELDPVGTVSKLVVRGPYAHIRHPRYVQLLMALAAYTLFANYLTCYIVFALTVIGIRIVIAFEERELLVRFGDAYRWYMETTPRFVPKL